MKSLLNKQWMSARGIRYIQCAYIPSAEYESAVESLYGSKLFALFLMARHVSLAQLEAFRYPSLRNSDVPVQQVKGLTDSAKAIVAALKSGETIGIISDYDVDGVTSATLFAESIHYLGGKFQLEIPQRAKDGYGVNVRLIQKLKQQNIKLIVVLDSGSTANNVFKITGGEGIIVVDHHQIQEDMPPVQFFINPKQDNSHLDSLCTVGLSFLLLSQVFKQIQANTKWLLGRLDLVAIGTVCDMVPLTALNRAYVRGGLQILNTTTLRPGLHELLLQGYVGSVTEDTIAYRIGPVLNACSRMGYDRLGFDVLYEGTQSCVNLALTLNRKRQELQRESYDDVVKKINLKEAYVGKSLICVGGEYDSGIVGILAGKIKEHYGKVAIVLNESGHIPYKGSGRSIPSVNLAGLINQSVEHKWLAKGGGHYMAVGLESNDNAKILGAKIDSLITHREPYDVYVDEFFSLPAFTLDFLNALHTLAPFGVGNPRPVIGIHDVQIKQVHLIKDQHLRCVLEDIHHNKRTAILFHGKNTPIQKSLNGMKSLIVNLSENYYQDRRSVSIHIEDVLL